MDSLQKGKMPLLPGGGHTQSISVYLARGHLHKLGDQCLRRNMEGCHSPLARFSCLHHRSGCDCLQQCALSLKAMPHSNPKKSVGVIYGLDMTWQGLSRRWTHNEFQCDDNAKFPNRMIGPHKVLQQCVSIFPESMLANRFPGEARSNQAITACVGKQWPTALQLFSDLHALDLQSSIITFSAAASACEGQWLLCWQLLNQLRDARILTTGIPYNAVASACEKATEWKSALQIIMEVERNRLSTAVTYGFLVFALGGVGRLVYSACIGPWWNPAIFDEIVITPSCIGEPRYCPYRVRQTWCFYSLFYSERHYGHETYQWQ